MDEKSKEKLKSEKKCSKMKYTKFVVQQENSDKQKTDNEPTKAKKMKKSKKDMVGPENNLNKTTTSASKDFKCRDDINQPSSESDPSSTNSKLGQWTTAQLSDSSKQEKFVRLLGGMKSKNNSGTVTSSCTGNRDVVGKLSGVCKPASRNKLWGKSANKNKLWGNRQSVEKKKFASMALNATETEEFSTKLEEQYNNALEFKLQKIREGNRSKGLGYQEEEKPEVKKKGLHIDINEKKSVSLE